MAVLKSEQAARKANEAVVLDLGDLGRQAERLREAAEERARRIIAEAQEQAKQLTEGAAAKGREQGLAEGREQGLAEGREQGRQEAVEAMQPQLQQMQQAWTKALAEWEGQRKQMDSEARQAVTRFAMRLAEKVVHRTVEVDSTVVVDQVAGALSHVLRPGDAKVHVHPEDKALVEEAVPGLLGEFHHLEHIALKEDEAVGRGGCVVTYGQGRVDATVETQLRRIAETLLPGGEADGVAGGGEGEAPAEGDGTGFAGEACDERS